MAQEATRRSAVHNSRRRRRDIALCGGIGHFSTSTSSGSETRTLTWFLVRSRAKRKTSNDVQSSQNGSWHGWSLELMSSSTLTVGPREAKFLIQRKEHQMLFLRPQTSYIQNLRGAGSDHLDPSRSRKPMMTNHDIQYRYENHLPYNVHSKIRALTPPSLPNQALAIRNKTPKSARESHTFTSSASPGARAPPRGSKRFFGYRKPHLRVPKILKMGFCSAHHPPHLSSYNSSRSDEPCIMRCDRYALRRLHRDFLPTSAVAFANYFGR